jgi:serine/threonine protein phosphatase 1
MRYAIGDIHGCISPFREMVETLIKLTPDDTLFLLGDYIDRGPDSSGVIDYILKLKGSGYDIRPIMGNHEFMLLESLENETGYILWCMNGSDATLLSYGIKREELSNPRHIRKIPFTHLDFFHSLPLYIEDKDFLFVHAGISSTHPDPLKDPDTLLWTRSEQFPEALLKGRKVIHGHSPCNIKDIKARISDPESRVINLDGGCVYHGIPERGKLVGLNLETFELFSCDYRY